MPDDKGRLFSHEIADRAGITPADFRTRVHRGYAPQPVDRVRHEGAIRAVWDPAEIEQYLIDRRGRLAARATSGVTSTDVMTCDGGSPGGFFPTACGRDFVHPSHPLGLPPTVTRLYPSEGGADHG